MKHLLDLNDLMEEEFAQIYQTEKLLDMFLAELRQRTDYVPLLEWINAYQTMCEAHMEELEFMLLGMFIRLEPVKSNITEDIIKDYASKMNRTPDELIREEEAILALYRLIHHKIACYSTLFIHTKALKLWTESEQLERQLVDERSMESSLGLLTEEHNVFVDDWYV